MDGEVKGDGRGEEGEGEEKKKPRRQREEARGQVGRQRHEPGSGEREGRWGEQRGSAALAPGKIRERSVCTAQGRSGSGRGEWGGGVVKNQRGLIRILSGCLLLL